MTIFNEENELLQTEEILESAAEEIDPQDGEPEENEEELEEILEEEESEEEVESEEENTEA